jgi:hypothetical protein
LAERSRRRKDDISAPFDGLGPGLPGNPLSLLILVLVVDALAVSALALLDFLQAKRQHRPSQR